VVEIVMPRLSDSMEEGTILKWLRSDGDAVKRGDPLAEIETDKATLSYEADAAGVLTIVASAGETHPIGTVIARLEDSGGGAGGDGADEAVDAKAPAEPVSEGVPVDKPAAEGAPVQAEPAPAPPAPAPAPGSSSGRVKASPLARRIARERGIDLQALAGSGPGGRIVRDDVESALPTDETAAVPAAPALEAPPAQPGATSEPGAAKGDLSVQQLTRTQQLIARRMAESKATIPDFALRSEIDMEACRTLRSDLKALGGEVPSYNDMVVKACALALREFPRANGSYRDGHFELHGRVNVGVAVAAPDVLAVPTVFDADRKSLREIARETRALAERVRAGSVTPPQLSGGTFTVSNLGMYGVSDFTAVINPPQAAILAIGQLAQRAVVRNAPSGAQGGALTARHMMSVTLSCDHRILYGADAAQFLARIRALLEQPLALMYQ
jgi:pyruvate dehydrogenase E2 component (dihydrolipoamide acetyltransferase)